MILFLLAPHFYKEKCIKKWKDGCYEHYISKITPGISNLAQNGL